MTTDTMVGACIPLAIGFGVWVAKQFVKQEVGAQGEHGEKGDKGDPGDMSVKQFQSLCKYLVTELNGRYMLAEEARERFDKLERRVNEVLERVQKL